MDTLATAARKHVKYAVIVTTHAFIPVAVAVESAGPLGHEAIEFLTDLDIHLQSVIYCWTVSICRMSAEDTSLLRVSEICLKPSTIVLLLILSK